jgi:hypothetical protein
MTSAAQTGMESTGSRYRGSIIASLCSTSSANVPSAKVGGSHAGPVIKLQKIHRIDLPSAAADPSGVLVGYTLDITIAQGRPWDGWIGGVVAPYYQSRRPVFLCAFNPLRQCRNTAAKLSVMHLCIFVRSSSKLSHRRALPLRQRSCWRQISTSCAQLCMR